MPSTDRGRSPEPSFDRGPESPSAAAPPAFDQPSLLDHRSPASPKFGMLGGTGIALLGVGLAGGAIFVWQRIAADDRAREAEEIRGTISDIASNPDDFMGDRLEVLSELNQADQDRLDHELAANAAIGVGGVLAAAGLVLIALDLLNDEEQTAVPLVVGPSQVSFELRF